MDIICISLLGMVLWIVLWFSIPYMKLNHLIVWLNRNRKSRECDWISDQFQSLLCVTKSKRCFTEIFTLVNTKNRILIDTPFRIRICVELKVENCSILDGTILTEINEKFIISFVYKNFKWVVISVE